MDYICDSKLDAENTCSKILQGIIWPSTYIKLKQDICRINITKNDSNLYSMILSIQKKLCDSMGLLKDSKVEKFYFGEDEELFNQLEEILIYNEEMIPIYGQAVSDMIEHTKNVMEQELEKPDGFYNLGPVLGWAKSQNPEIQRLDGEQYTAKQTAAAIKDILEVYGKGVKIPKKPKFTKYNEDYHEFLYDLQVNIVDMDVGFEVAYCIGTAINYLSMLILQKDNLDPYITDELDNLVDVYMHPEDYYSMCNQEKIVGTQVPMFFAAVYNRFYHLFVDMYLDKYSEMTYQEQINFRRCFCLTQDDSQILALCSASINLSNATQGALQQ